MRQAQDTAVVNFKGLSDGVVGVNRRREDAERQCQDLV
jgi:hypothetical protein